MAKDLIVYQAHNVVKDNKEHWKKEIKAFLDKAENLLKRVKGKTREALKKTIDELRHIADEF